MLPWLSILKHKQFISIPCHALSRSPGLSSSHSEKRSITTFITHLFDCVCRQKRWWINEQVKQLPKQTSASLSAVLYIRIPTVCLWVRKPGADICLKRLCQVLICSVSKCECIGWQLILNFDIMTVKYHNTLYYFSLGNTNINTCLIVWLYNVK